MDGSYVDFILERIHNVGALVQRRKLKPWKFKWEYVPLCLAVRLRMPEKKDRWENDIGGYEWH